MGRVLIVGRGQLGSAVRDALSDVGHEVVSVSRSVGVDVTAPLSFEQYAGFDTVVEATDVNTRDRARAKSFFETSTTNIKSAANAAGIRRHVLASIVNCEQPVLDSNGYYAAKAAQERQAVRVEGPPTVVVRSTLWFEFAQQNLGRMSFGPVALVPMITTRPVALSAVARRIAARCLADGPDREDLCGPELLSLGEMTRALRRRKPVLLPVPAGRGLRDGSLVSSRCEVVGPRFADWNSI